MSGVSDQMKMRECVKHRELSLSVSLSVSRLGIPWDQLPPVPAISTFPPVRGLSSNKQVLHEAAFVPYRSTAMKKVKQLEEMCKQESLAPKEI